MGNVLLVKLLLREIKVALIPLISLLVVYIANPLYAASLDGYGGAYLRAPVGATAFSLGGAQTASPKYLCSWWNPAALVYYKQKKLTLGTGYRPLGRTEGYLSFEFPVPPRVAIGLSMLYRGDPFLKDLVDEQEYPLEDGAYTTLSFKIGVSYLIKRRLSAGFNFSVYYQRLPTDYDRKGNLIYTSITAIGGFDIGLRFVPTKSLSFGLVLKNILAYFNWEIKDQYEDLSAMFSDTLPATINLGQELKTTLFDKPFIWTYDIVGYIFNGNFKPLDHCHAVINNGFEWQRWELFFIRAGVRDIEFNRDIISNRDEYKDYFTLAVSLGFLIDLSTALEGKDIKFNYGISTDKVGAGVDQQLDFVVSF